MARKLFDTGIFSIVTPSSAIGVGWQLAFYTANTASQITTYNAPSGGSANPNPVPSDAEGRFPEIWIEDGQSIKWSLLDDDGVVQVTVDDYSIPDAPPSFSALLFNFLSNPASNPLPIAYGGTASTSAVNALTALGAFPAAGGTVTGNITRSTKGVHLYWNTAAQTSGRIFLTVDSDPDPTSAAGDIWMKYA